MDFYPDEKTVEPSPFLQFRAWYSYAIMNNVQDADAMTLCTVDAQGKPSSRVVYMRDLESDGLVFFTNYHSRKGRDINSNPNVCSSFFWQPLGRQVRIEGTIEKINEEDSDAYFMSRPRESRIGAWASAQSSELESRQELESRFAALEKIFENKEVIRPEWWGGYRIIPVYFEFWHGRDNRLHDRISYRLGEDGNWKIGRLSP